MVTLLNGLVIHEIWFHFRRRDRIYDRRTTPIVLNLSNNSTNHMCINSVAS